MSDNKYNNVMHLGNPTNTIAVLNRYGFDFKKKFGQNFLIDENVVEKIVREAGVTKDDFVVEVGPGIGTMTQILCENAREVVAVEIDKKLIPILTEDTLSYYDNVTVINEDILKLDIKKLADEKNEGRQKDAGQSNSSSQRIAKYKEQHQDNHGNIAVDYGVYHVHGIHFHKREIGRCSC